MQRLLSILKRNAMLLQDMWCCGSCACLARAPRQHWQDAGAPTPGHLPVVCAVNPLGLALHHVFACGCLHAGQMQRGQWQVQATGPACSSSWCCWRYWLQDAHCCGTCGFQLLAQPSCFLLSCPKLSKHGIVQLATCASTAAALLVHCSCNRPRCRPACCEGASITSTSSAPASCQLRPATCAAGHKHRAQIAAVNQFRCPT
jgi:hypothetical protein